MEPLNCRPASPHSKLLAYKRLTINWYVSKSISPERQRLDAILHVQPSYSLRRDFSGRRERGRTDKYDKHDEYDYNNSSSCDSASTTGSWRESEADPVQRHLGKGRSQLGFSAAERWGGYLAGEWRRCGNFWTKFHIARCFSKRNCQRVRFFLLVSAVFMKCPWVSVAIQRSHHRKLGRPPSVHL